VEENDLVKAGMEVVLRPITDIAENLLGLVGGDWLSEARRRRREELKRKTEEILRKRDAIADDEPSPTVVIPLLSAAQDEGREELIDLWAALLAAAIDPARKSRYRRQFVDIVKQLEPVDAVVLRALVKEGGGVFYEQRKDFADSLGITEDQMDVSFGALRNVDLINEAFLRQGVHEASSLAHEMCFAIET
jgi:hypothetical protein